MWQISSYQTYARSYIIKNYDFDIQSLGTGRLFEYSEKIYDEEMKKFNRIRRTSDEIFTDLLIRKLISEGIII